jgi:hypothetical protein
MGLVAFDLDNTLGSFDVIGPWANFFSVETLENDRNKIIFSKTLEARLRAAEDLLIEKIKGNKELLEKLFRPNLDALIIPLVKAKKSGKVRAVCMYSNTTCTFAMYFAKRIIEERYACPGFFDCLVDATHPIRKYDWEQNKVDKIQPLKTFIGLKKIFKTLCGITGTIQPTDILFVDDRVEKHHLAQEERDGLVYLQVSGYVPNVSKSVRGHMYLMGLQTLLEKDLTNDPEYLLSDVFHKSDTGGFFSLLEDTAKAIMSPYFPPQPFKEDSMKIRRVITTFLTRFSKSHQRMK